MEPHELKRYFGKPVVLLREFQGVPAGTHGIVTNVFSGAGMRTLDIEWYVPEMICDEGTNLYLKSAVRKTITFLGELELELLEGHEDFKTAVVN